MMRSRLMKIMYAQSRRGGSMLGERKIFPSLWLLLPHRSTARRASIQRLLWTDGRRIHRCPGYVREEITLATRTADSVVVSHDAPTPLEVCSVCHETVDPGEVFQCVCGDSSPGLRATSKCPSCKSWSHRECAPNSNGTTCGLCVSETSGLSYSTGGLSGDQDVDQSIDDTITSVWQSPIHTGPDADVDLMDKEQTLAAMPGLKDPSWGDTMMMPGFLWTDSPRDPVEEASPYPTPFISPWPSPPSSPAVDSGPPLPSPFIPPTQSPQWRTAHQTSTILFPDFVDSGPPLPSPLIPPTPSPQWRTAYQTSTILFPDLVIPTSMGSQSVLPSFAETFLRDGIYDPTSRFNPSLDDLDSGREMSSRGRRRLREFRSRPYPLRERAGGPDGYTQEHDIDDTVLWDRGGAPDDLMDSQSLSPVVTESSPVRAFLPSAIVCHICGGQSLSPVVTESSPVRAFLPSAIACHICGGDLTAMHDHDDAPDRKIFLCRCGRRLHAHGLRHHASKCLLAGSASDSEKHRLYLWEKGRSGD